MKSFLHLSGKVTHVPDRRRFIKPVTAAWHPSVLLGSLLAVLLISCNSAGKTNNSAIRPKAEARVVMPVQQVATPEGINYVYDYENIFTAVEEKKLDSLAKVFEKSNLIAIRIETVTDPSVNAENFDQHNKSLLEEWSAIHGKSERCLSISISKQLRRIRIDYGSFVLRLLSDDEAKGIVENHFKPSFKQDQFYQGTWNGLNALMNTIRSNIKF